MLRYITFALFAATIPAANWLIGNMGVQLVESGPHMIPVGFGLLAPSGVLMVGAALVLRDAVHEQMGVWGAVAAIMVGGALSAVFSAPALVLASFLAFIFSEAADLWVYTPLREKRLGLAVLASGVVGAIVDSAVFLWLAFGSLAFIEGQIVGKIWMSLAAFAVMALARLASNPRNEQEITR